MRSLPKARRFKRLRRFSRPSLYFGSAAVRRWLVGWRALLLTIALAGLLSALALVLRLAVRGIAASVAVCATQLEENDGRWTGRIVGDAMFGEAKWHAVRRLAAEKGFELARCYAYGDDESDRWMLEAVGRPVAVNPTRKLEKLARRREWAVMAWKKGNDSRQVSPETQRRVEETWEKVK